MTTGRVVHLTGPEEIEFGEYEVPEAGPGTIVAEVARANVCGSDLHTWHGEHPQVMDTIPGHEAVCRAIDVGEGMARDNAGEPIEEGDLIVPVYSVTCNECPSCLIGDFHRCQNAYRHRGNHPDDPPHFHGFFATHVVLYDDQYRFKVPDGLDLGVAAMANCVSSQAIFGLEEAGGVGPGDTVVVQGAGGLGLNVLAVADESGAETIAIEGAPARVDRAREFGADHVVDMNDDDTVDARADRVRELTDGNGADLVVEVAGVPEAFAEGIEHVRMGGRFLEMGNVIPGRTVEFDPGKMTRKSIDLTALIKYDPWYLHEALAFLDATDDDYPWEELIDAEFALEDIETAYERSSAREITRATLNPHP